MTVEISDGEVGKKVVGGNVQVSPRRVEVVNDGADHNGTCAQEWSD